MYVENLLLIIDQNDLPLDDWHRQFVSSVAIQLDAGKSLSSRQAAVILKLAQQLRQPLVTQGWMTEDEIDDLLTAPQYHNPPYESMQLVREVRYLGNNLLAFRFKPDDRVRSKIKALAYAPTTRWMGRMDAVVPHLKPRFDWLYKLWIVPVYPYNLSRVLDLIHSDRFRTDHTVTGYLTLCRQSFDQTSVFAVDHNTDVILANVCNHPILAAWVTEVAEGVPL